jgi:hypothetical protein
MQGSIQDAARASRRRPRAALATAALCATAATMLFSAAAAPAAITTGPVDAASGFPFSYTDDVQQFSLEQCQDLSGFCIEAPRPDPAQPISVPDNYTPDGEGFWWLADAVVPNAGTGLARFGKESAFDNDEISNGHQVSFSRIRFRFQGLVAGDTYRITHPYGVDELVAEPDPKGGGRINFTNDVGCIGPPCGDFPAIAGDPITAFLRWDPNVAPAAPAGYIGNAVTPHKVIGSPNGTNFVRLEHLVAQPPLVGLVPVLVGETDQFAVQGKLAGPPPPPAPHIGFSTRNVAFGDRQVGSPSAATHVDVTNHGTADMTVGTLALTGPDAADFTVATDTCSGQTLAAGTGCGVDVRFSPAHTGDLGATLSVPSDSAGSPHGIVLSGRGLASAGATGGGAVSGGGTSTTTIITRVIPVVGQPTGAVAGSSARAALRVSGLTLARRISISRARARGLSVAMTLPRGTQVVRIAVYRSRNGLASGRPLARVLRLPTRSGRYVVNLRSRALLRSLRAGRYAVQVTPGRSLDDRGRTSSLAFTVTP